MFLMFGLKQVVEVSGKGMVLIAVDKYVLLNVFNNLSFSSLSIISIKPILAKGFFMILEIIVSRRLCKYIISFSENKSTK